MKISGFSMAKNANKLYYPLKQAIMSILPIVDEFVVAIGDCDNDDSTRADVLSINSDKIKIIDTVWDIEKYSRGTENAHQTDIAKEACSGDWLFYLQSDEVVHEKFLPIIYNRAKQLLNDKEVEGLLFNYKHFWGDYNHYHRSHAWYANEIRMVRNDKDIHSWESAQSFRRIPDFDYTNYRQQESTYKLHVAQVDADIYHYGWVRPPHLMQKKQKSLDTIHKGKATADKIFDAKPIEFDYGDLSKIPIFKDTHPEVMKEWIDMFDWAEKLNYGNKSVPNREQFKHERPIYKFLSFVENYILRKQIFSFQNYILLDK